MTNHTTPYCLTFYNGKGPVLRYFDSRSAMNSYIKLESKVCSDHFKTYSQAFTPAERIATKDKLEAARLRCYERWCSAIKIGQDGVA